MAEEKEVILTKEGLQKLEAELEHLKSVRREEVAERIKQAIAFGDISENSEYEDAKNEQAFIEGRIMVLEKTLKKARLMEDDDIRTDVVSLGSRVTLKEMKSGREVTLLLVSSAESKLKDGKISDESPVGRAILGKKVKSTVEVEAPVGKIKYKILKVEK
ncbi:transcription elongation factor GreA [Syntrophomonas palmitatica]|uniref:transcription elongation factor GreA n=1 Tax=Syntrophomonas palmitatica TaxID=402877 RepID=UPI0006D0584D|nr:transcription elongation factor GreA [Syntrophomonas palmitatica]